MPIKFGRCEQFAPLLRQIVIALVKYGLLPQTAGTEMGEGGEMLSFLTASSRS